MGGYRLVIHRKASKALERLPIVALERLREALTEIAEQPQGAQGPQAPRRGATDATM